MALYASFRGGRWTYPNTSGAIIPGGTVLLIDGTTPFIGIVLNDIAIGSTGELMVGGSAEEGVFNLPKLSTDVFTYGQIAYWDFTNKRLTVTATNNTSIGRIVGTYASGSTTAFCALNRR